MKFPYIIGSCLLVVILASSGWLADARYEEIITVDRDASKETKALYANLKELSKAQILFGQQDALAYGVNWKDWHKHRSDVKDVTGQHPAVFGWDLSKLGTQSYNIDSIDFKQMRGWVKEVYKMGGVNTFSYHMDNFEGGSSWEPAGNTVGKMLPGGDYHEAYKKRLDIMANFISDLRVGFLFKTDIPIIFRPFHEHTGGWFWWGREHTTPEEYIAMWRFTVKYLTEEKELHNILYAYSPDIFADKAEYLECYPGDDYVDILGFDDYHDVGPNGQIEDLTRRLRMVVELADEKNKVAALTETGYDGIPDSTWYTDQLLQHIQSDPTASRIAWLLVWRNARLSHHYVPFPSHPSAVNFVKFSKSPLMVFGDDVPRMYELH